MACLNTEVHGQPWQSHDGSDAGTPTSKPTLTRRAVAAGNDTEVCPAGVAPGNYEYAAGKGRDGQGVSYGIPMMQADRLAAVANKGNVLFCLVLTGIDERNKDIPKVKGCIPGTPRVPGGPPRDCYPLTGVTRGDGGMVALSIIGALDNSFGLKGIIPDANAYIYSVYNTSLPGTFPEPTGSALVAGYKDCEAELDARKANRIPGTPPLNMVVFSDGFVTEGVDAVAAYSKSVTARRNDVMFVAGAWGIFDENETWVDVTPASFPQFVAIASVNKDFESSTGTELPVNFTAFSAPGQFIMWTSLLSDYNLDALDAWGQRKNTIAASPPLDGVQADFWNSPPPGAFAGSAVGSVAAGLVDCGLGNSTCAGAKGKICLIQRGGSTFAEKVLNCIKGEGIAVVIYARDNQGACERVTGNLVGVVVNDTVVTSPLPGGWPVVIGASLQQGKALLSALQAGKLTSLTITSPARTPTKVPITFSDTSSENYNTYYAACMATGALGALWSAHPSCSRQQILAAVSETAKPKLNSGLPDWEVKARYGKGLLQVWDAHEYLVTNPCKPTPTLTITTSLNSKPFPKDQKDTDAAGQHFGGTGSFFKVTVVVRNPVTRNAVSGVPVTLALDPAGLASCKVTQRTTGRKVGAVWSCSHVRGASGALTITATSAESAWYASATSSITVTL
uniref:PA domain-containing protein n=1 Tax=Tetradesmus obliquus TaxID=3088 RepID=A0A383VAT4_TETOB|eukprot:jgi/Sobl393_1/11508/SZX62050.1